MILIDLYTLRDVEPNDSDYELHWMHPVLILQLMAPFLLSMEHIHTIVLFLFPIISNYGSVQQAGPFATKVYVWFYYWPGYTTKLIKICKSRIRAHEKQMKKTYLPFGLVLQQWCEITAFIYLWVKRTKRCQYITVAMIHTLHIFCF